MARGLIEQRPATEVRLDLLRQLLDKARGTAARNQLLDPLDPDEIDHDLSPSIRVRAA